MARSVCAAALAALALLAALVGCGSEEPRPYKVGVIADCVGFLRALGEPELAGAQLPLLRRGARPRGKRPQDGVTTATVGDRPVRLVQGCTESIEFSTLTQEVRRLVENEHVDAIVAGAIGADHVVLRELAARYPRVTFLPAAHGPREVMGPGNPRNLFRVSADESQSAAGLGTYARRELGWRRAAVVYADWDSGWGARDVFVREFCALGGRVEQVASAAFEPGDLARVPRDVDGTVVFSGRPLDPTTMLRGLARRNPDPRALLVGAGIAGDREWVAGAGGALTGVAATATVPPPASSPGRRSYRRAFVRAFPGLPASTADDPAAITFNNAVDGLLHALERAGGDPAEVGLRLAALDADLSGVRTRLDAGGQAIVPISLVRIGRPGGEAPGQTLLRTTADVDRSVGGTIAPGAVPSGRPARCVRPRAS